MTKVLVAVVAAGALAFAAEKAVKMSELPAAVRDAITKEAKGADLKGFSRETEKGKTFYEAETVLNGKHRDLLFDGSGALVEVEEETSLDAIPTAAKAALEKAAAGGKITKLETVTAGSNVKYEAAIARGKKKSEVAVAADGSIVKD